MSAQTAPRSSNKPIEKYQPQTLEREWGTEQFVCETKDYLVKILRMKAGTKGGFQKHILKDESFFLMEGEAWVEYDRGDGEKVGVYMYPGETYHIPPQAPHRVEAITDCIFIEGSTPVHNDRFHAEHEYGEEVETGGLPSTWVFDTENDEYRRVG